VILIKLGKMPTTKQVNLKKLFNTLLLIRIRNIVQYTSELSVVPLNETRFETLSAQYKMVVVQDRPI